MNMRNEMTKLESNVVTPMGLFQKPVQYEVPEFQRHYVWNKENQWEPLWDDIIGKTQDSMETQDLHHHFMGAIALQLRPGSSTNIEARVIVDGQQRLITLQVLIDGIRQACERREYGECAKRLSAMVYNNSEWWDDNPNVEYKVWPSIHDRDAFRHVIRKDNPEEEFRNTSIFQARDYFKSKTEEWLDQYAEESGARRRAAESLERTVSRGMELAVIDLRLVDTPHIIFETLNARGTPLLPSDMIKNRILYEAKVSPSRDDEEITPEEKQLWSFNGEWWRERTGRGNQRRPRIDAYLNNWLTLRNRAETKNKNEFDLFSEYLKKSDVKNMSIHDIAADINSVGKIYEAIERTSIENIQQFLRRRQTMGIGGVIPVLLWLLSSNVPHHQLTKSVVGLESYIVRRMICGLGARNYGQFFANLVSELEEAGAEAAGDTIIRHLKQQEASGSEWPNDQSLLETFLTKPIYKLMPANRINMILQGIEGQLRSTMSETQEVPQTLHVEHIMPQEWYKTWPLRSNAKDRVKAADERDRQIHTLGNLTLVSRRLNSGLSNAPWKEKRVTLGKYTVLRLNWTLLDSAPKNWSEKAIQARGRMLHKEAIKVWPYANSIK